MNKKPLASLLLACAALTGFVAAQADAVNSTCSMTTRLFPANNVTDTIAASCQHQSAGRAASSATFVAKNQSGTKTLQVTMGCCPGTSAKIEGLDGSNNPIAGCTKTVAGDSSGSLTCNSAARWRSSIQYFE